MPPCQVWTILVAMSDAADRELLQAAFRHDGFDVLLAADGPAAVDLLASYEPDILVLDLMLPVLGAMDVIRRARDMGIAPVVFTAIDAACFRRQSEEAGAAAFVRKGGGVKDLRSAVRGLLESASGPPEWALSGAAVYK